MQRLFAAPGQIDEAGAKIHILGQDVNHIKNVLRMKVGQELWVSDGQEKEYHCTISEYQEDEILLQILYIQKPNYELPSKIYLFQGLPKSDKMELIIQKAVELGAYSVIPVRTERSVVKLDDQRAKKKTARWQQIAQSAAEQSKRMYVPTVAEPLSFKEALKIASNLDVVLIPYELEHGMSATCSVIDSIRPGQSIAVFIGPEGGFEPSEVEAAISLGAHPISLGSRILRTETAGLTALSILMYHLESHLLG